ncbi:MAG: hypothetical protein AB1805_14265 [Nitrospirota bacterium]
MPINPLSNAGAAATVTAADKKAKSDISRDDAVRAAASAEAARAGARSSDDEKEVRKVVEVQQQEGKSEVRRAIDKFA